MVVCNLAHRTDYIGTICARSRDFRANNLLDRFLEGTTASRRVVVVREERDAEDLRVGGRLKGKLGHVSEVNGGRVINSLERTGGIEMARSVRADMPILG